MKVVLYVKFDCISLCIGLLDITVVYVIGQTASVETYGFGIDRGSDLRMRRNR